MAWGVTTGHWLGATDKYLALKLVKGSNTYYGWARLDFLHSSGSFIIKDYAFESKPNTCIQSGQITSGILENPTKSVFSITPNPFISSAIIKTSLSLKNATLRIYNTQGQMVRQVRSISGQIATISRDNLPSGLYFVQLSEDDKILGEEKLIVAD